MKLITTFFLASVCAISCEAAKPTPQATAPAESAGTPEILPRPDSRFEGMIPAYNDFLEQRRKLMALKIQTWFEAL